MKERYNLLKKEIDDIKKSYLANYVLSDSDFIELGFNSSVVEKIKN